MKTIFTDIYNKILELFQIEKSQNTGECAASRLQVILMHDRTKLDPLIMAKMREELIGIFSKYVVIDKEKLEIDLTNQGDAAALMLNIPIIRAKTEEELEQIREELKKAEEDNSAETKETEPAIQENSAENQNQETKEAEENVNAPNLQNGEIISSQQESTPANQEKETAAAE